MQTQNAPETVPSTTHQQIQVETAQMTDLWLRAQLFRSRSYRNAVAAEFATYTSAKTAYLTNPNAETAAFCQSVYDLTSRRIAQLTAPLVLTGRQPRNLQ
jgi:hypothetical protein